MAKIPQEEDQLIVITQSAKEARDYELLFLAREIPFSRKTDPSQHTLVIPNAFSTKAKREMELFHKENRRWPSNYALGMQKTPHFPFIHEIVLLCLAAFHWISTRPNAPHSWIEKGRSSAEDILSGQWTRSVTALTLHGDYTHLLSNLAALWLFVSGVSQYVGSGMAWFLVLLSGALGNILSAWFFGIDHFSIGASTSVFGAVGILGGMRAISRFFEGATWKRSILPIAAALALLAMLGANPETDVMAHLFGFLAGLVVGLLSASLCSEKLAGKATIQWLAFGVFGLTVVMCWVERLKDF